MINTLVTPSNSHNIEKGVVLPPCYNYSLHIIIIETLKSIKMESKAHPAINAKIYILYTIESQSFGGELLRITVSIIGTESIICSLLNTLMWDALV